MSITHETVREIMEMVDNVTEDMPEDALPDMAAAVAMDLYADLPAAEEISDAQWEKLLGIAEAYAELRFLQLGIEV